MFHSPLPCTTAHLLHSRTARALVTVFTARRQLFFHELSQCLFDFVIQLLPTAEEMAIKEDVRRLLEKLIKTIEPDSRLLSFGSTANGFSLRNSGTSLLVSWHYSFLTDPCMLCPCRYGPMLPPGFKRAAITGLRSCHHAW